MQLRPRATLAVLSGCLFLSGAAGLACEIVLSRYLGLFLGHASSATVAVLVAFMGGLMIGNPVFGRLADRQLAGACRLYALLESGIALYAFLFLATFPAAQSFFIQIARHLPAVTSLRSAFQFATALAITLPPAVLMGGTLPVAARLATRQLSELDRSVGRLYLVNSLGGSLGCLLAGFWWLPAWGLGGALGIAAVLNAVAGAIACFLPNLQIRTATPKSPVADPQTDLPSTGVGDIRLIMGALALAGFAGMLYEIAWTRLLALVLGSTGDAFVLMLATFVGGIALGSAGVSALKPRWNRIFMLAACEGVIALVVALMLPLYSMLPYVFARAAGWFAPDPTGYPIYLAAQSMMCITVMLPPAILLGMTLPLACRAATRDRRDTGKSVGLVFGANTAGAVAGTLAVGLWLLPTLGLARTFGLGIGINTSIGVMFLAAGPARFRRQNLLLVPVLMLAGPWLTGRLCDQKWEQSLSLGLWRQPGVVRSLADYQNLVAENHLKYYRDGTLATVSVNIWSSGGTEQLNLRIDGKPDASTAGDLVTQLLLGHLPMLLRPETSHALVIGLGSGITSGAVSRHSSIQRVDTVEISPDVVAAARLFGNANHHVLDDPRHHVVVDDARSFLQLTTNQYGVIVSEPSNPWIAGMAGLFTREFYASCRDRLPPDGLMVQWVHLYDNNQAALDLVLRTFSSVFPDVAVWQSEELDLILVGSARGVRPDLDSLLKRLAEPAVHADLARVFLDRPPLLLARELIPAGQGRFLANANGPVERDLKPRLESLAQRALFAHANATNWLVLNRNLSPHAQTLLGRYLRSHPLDTADYRAFAVFQRVYRVPGAQLMRSLCLRWQSDPTAQPAMLQELAVLPPLGSLEEAEALRLTPLRDFLLRSPAEHLPLLRRYAELLLRTYQSQRSIFFQPHSNELSTVLNRLLETDQTRETDYQFALAELAWDRGDPAACVEFTQRGLKRARWKEERDDPEFCSSLARYLRALAELDRRPEAVEASRLFETEGCHLPELAAEMRSIQEKP